MFNKRIKKINSIKESLNLINELEVMLSLAIIGMDNDEATVKRLLIKDNQVIFMPENPDFSPIYPEKPMVLGKVVGSFRKY